ncbi:hypothetical protein BU17DRAFT_98740 [Hysterangium stoloniferum]|nr:hypothetical protein BU17DRAFT_98740 [Hysterangium stoloniferum]
MSDHSPRILEDNHGAEVDIWGVGHLLTSSTASDISSEFKALGKSSQLMQLSAESISSSNSSNSGLSDILENPRKTEDIVTEERHIINDVFGPEPLETRIAGEQGMRPSRNVSSNLGNLSSLDRSSLVIQWQKSFIVTLALET